MDPYNGEILALASSPNFDPSVFVDEDSSSIFRILNDPDSPLINRAISSSYPAAQYSSWCRVRGIRDRKNKFIHFLSLPGKGLDWQ